MPTIVYALTNPAVSGPVKIVASRVKIERSVTGFPWSSFWNG